MIKPASAGFFVFMIDNDFSSVNMYLNDAMKRFNPNLEENDYEHHEHD